MGVNRVSNGSDYSDLRLTLKREGNKVVSVLSFYDSASGSINVHHDSLPDWHVIDAGVSVFQNPESHPGNSIAAMGEELARVAFGSEIVATLAAHLQSKKVRLWVRSEGDLARLPWEASSFSEGSGPVAGILSMHPGLSLIRDIGGAAN